MVITYPQGRDSGTGKMLRIAGEAGGTVSMVMNQGQLIRQGMGVWREWLIYHPRERVDLPQADLHAINFEGGLLWNANLERADLSNANLRGANLSNANLCGADLSNADLRWADLSGANLSDAKLDGALTDNARMPQRGV